MRDSNSFIEVSAPCRVDMAGTVDLDDFSGLLGEKTVATFNIAIDIRTIVKIAPYKKDKIKITSKGFEPLEFYAGDSRSKASLGLIAAISYYFNAKGIHIDVESLSPPQSGLGGSSAAGVATVYGLSKLYSEKPFSPEDTAITARKIEGEVLGIPCGFQDYLASTYGGVNLWLWPRKKIKKPFIRKKILEKSDFDKLSKSILIAYTGRTHESKDINPRFVKEYKEKKFVNEWKKIAELAFEFSEAIAAGNFKAAADILNTESEIRGRLADGIFNKGGKELIEAAAQDNCGAKFAGAGAGGCIWAIGEEKNIHRLKKKWKNILATFQDACILKSDVAKSGMTII